MLLVRRGHRLLALHPLGTVRREFEHLVYHVLAALRALLGLLVLKCRLASLDFGLRRWNRLLWRNVGRLDIHDLGVAFFESPLVARSVHDTCLHIRCLGVQGHISTADLFSGLLEAAEFEVLDGLFKLVIPIEVGGPASRMERLRKLRLKAMHN